jgi:hypothetical protein
VWRGAPENPGIVVIQPFESMVPVQRLNPCAHPAAKITMTVGIDFDFRLTVHESLRPTEGVLLIKTLMNE